MRSYCMNSLACQWVVFILALGQWVLAQSTLADNTTAVGISEPILTPDVDAYIGQVLASFGSPGGVAVSVVRRDASSGTWNVETKGYGNATAKGAKIDSDTLFAIASNSKLFTVLAVGQLISNGSISFNSKIKSLIPEWELQDPLATSASTIIDLMSHRTGLPRHDTMYSLKEEVPSVIQRLRFLKPSAEFRDIWQYSNIMYMVLSYLPTAVTGKPFTAYVKENIFDALGLNSTTYSFVRANATGRLADGFSKDGINVADIYNSGITRTVPFFLGQGRSDDSTTCTALCGPGGIISSANDMALWLQMLLLNGQHPLKNTSIVSAEVLSTVASGITVMSGQGSPLTEMSPVTYGGGQMRSAYRGHELIEHGGDLLGFHSQISRYPNDNLGIAVLSNDDRYGIPIREAIKSRLADVALGLPPIDWISRMKTLVEVVASSQPTPIPRSANATAPSAGFDALIGSYANKGYGNIELCLVNSNKSQSTSCDALARNASVLLPGVVDPSIPTYIAPLSGFEAGYHTFAHYQGDTFNLTSYLSQPTGNSSAPFWAMLAMAPSVVTFERNATGFGITGNFWGAAGTGTSEPQGETLADQSEVFFVKV